MAIENYYKTNPIDQAKFKTKGPWHGSYSHGYRYQKHKTKLGFPHALGHRPGELVEFVVLVSVHYAGHLAGMIGVDSSQSWGMAPNRGDIQPEMLGLGAVKMQVTGFLSVTVIKMDAAIAVLEADKELRNDVHKHSDGEHYIPTLADVQEMLRLLSPPQITTFTVAMGDNTMYKVTLGAGDTLIAPPGFLFVFSLLSHTNSGESNRNSAHRIETHVLQCNMSVACLLFHLLPA